MGDRVSKAAAAIVIVIALSLSPREYDMERRDVGVSRGGDRDARNVEVEPNRIFSVTRKT